MNTHTLNARVHNFLANVYFQLGIDQPANHDQIAEFIANDVQETADPINYHDGDIAIAFRRFLEKDSIS